VRILQSYLAIALALAVVAAIYLSLRDVPLPDRARIDRTLEETEPI